MALLRFVSMFSLLSWVNVLKCSGQPVYPVQSATACTGDELQLSCRPHEDTAIHLISAYFGSSQRRDGDQCNFDKTDCFLSVFTANRDAFLNLNTSCASRDSCDVQAANYSWTNRTWRDTDCASTGESDYVHIEYQCVHSTSKTKQYHISRNTSRPFDTAMCGEQKKIKVTKAKHWTSGGIAACSDDVTQSLGEIKEQCDGKQACINYTAPHSKVFCGPLGGYDSVRTEIIYTCANDPNLRNVSRCNYDIFQSRLCESGDVIQIVNAFHGDHGHHMNCTDEIRSPYDCLVNVDASYMNVIKQKCDVSSCGDLTANPASDTSCTASHGEWNRRTDYVTLIYRCVKGPRTVSLPTTLVPGKPDVVSPETSGSPHVTVPETPELPDVSPPETQKDTTGLPLDGATQAPDTSALVAAIVCPLVLVAAIIGTLGWVILQRRKRQAGESTTSMRYASNQHPSSSSNSTTRDNARNHQPTPISERSPTENAADPDHGYAAADEAEYQSVDAVDDLGSLSRHPDERLDPLYADGCMFQDNTTYVTSGTSKRELAANSYDMGNQQPRVVRQVEDTLITDNEQYAPWEGKQQPRVVRQVEDTLITDNEQYAPWEGNEQPRVVRQVEDTVITDNEQYAPWEGKQQPRVVRQVEDTVITDNEQYAPW